MHAWSGRRLNARSTSSAPAAGLIELPGPLGLRPRAPVGPRRFRGSRRPVSFDAKDIRTVSFDGQTALIRDLLGLRYLERLLAEPNREFHALDLVAVERGSLPVAPRYFDIEAGTRDRGHAGCHLDSQAREAYRRRLLEIAEDIEDATRNNDLGRIALAEADREFLINELSRAVGLDGRPRLALATSERARTSVTRTLRYAMTRIAQHHPRLGEHLRQAVTTGTYCVYRPDPRLPAHWET